MNFIEEKKKLYEQNARDRFCEAYAAWARAVNDPTASFSEREELFQAYCVARDAYHQKGYYFLRPEPAHA